MQTWRCPHCGTPQAESSRCWVCKRSSTTCATCRNFRRSIAGQLGYCGLDRQRLPLSGEELRGCWQGSREAREPSATAPDPPPVVTRPRRDFVPLETDRVTRAPAVAPTPPALAPGPASAPPPLDPLAGFWADEG